MKLNKTFAYALRATLVLARRYDGPFVSSKIVAAESGVSGKYLLCVLALLSRQGIVVSTRGFKGGFRLARSPQELSLFDIATACGELADDAGRLDDFPKNVADFMRGSLSEATRKLSAELDSLKISDVLGDETTNASPPAALSTSPQDQTVLASWHERLDEQEECAATRSKKTQEKRESA